ncbi:hypothetical protein ACT999_003600 [Escherichia coli]
MNTLFLLMAEFNTSNIELSAVSQIFPGAAGFDGENYEHLVFTDG